jgi:hypothetical protein
MMNDEWRMEKLRMVEGRYRIQDTGYRIQDTAP